MCIFVFIFKKNKGGNINERLYICNFVYDTTSVKLCYNKEEKIKSTGVFPLCVYIVLLYNMHIFFLFRKAGEINMMISFLMMIIFIFAIVLYTINEDMYKDRRIDKSDYIIRRTYTKLAYIICVSYFTYLVVSTIVKYIINLF